MNSRIREAICLKTQPVAVIQTDHLPPDAQGWETEHHGCILPRLEDAAEGKTVVVFQAHTNACPGSRAGLGFEKLSIDPMAELLSKGKEGHGGRFKNVCDGTGSSRRTGAGTLSVIPA